MTPVPRSHGHSTLLTKFRESTSKVKKLNKREQSWKGLGKWKILKWNQKKKRKKKAKPSKDSKNGKEDQIRLLGKPKRLAILAGKITSTLNNIFVSPETWFSHTNQFPPWYQPQGTCQSAGDHQLQFYTILKLAKQREATQQQSRERKNSLFIFSSPLLCQYFYPKQSLGSIIGFKHSPTQSEDSQ